MRLKKFIGSEGQLAYIDNRVTAFNELVSGISAPENVVTTVALVNTGFCIASYIFDNPAVRILTGVCALMSAAAVYYSRESVKSQVNELIEIYKWAMETNSTTILNIVSSTAIAPSHERNKCLSALIVTIAPYMADPHDIYSFALNAQENLTLNILCHLDGELVKTLNKNCLHAIQMLKQDKPVTRNVPADFTDGVKRALVAAIYGKYRSIDQVWPSRLEVNHPRAGVAQLVKL